MARQLPPQFLLIGIWGKQRAQLGLTSEVLNTPNLEELLL